MARLLIAAFKTTEMELSELLTPHELIYAHTVEEAQQTASTEQPDAIICSMLFDDSRMFDLLRSCKADPSTSEIPFICCQLALTQLPRAVLEGLSLATKALGGCDFLMLVGQQQDTIRLIESYLPEHLRLRS